MIRINLLPGQKKRGAARAAFDLEALKGLVKQVKDPLLVAVAASWVVGVGLLGFLYLSEESRLSELEEASASLQQEARRFRTLIAQKERAEGLRDSLRAELTAIRAIDQDRYVWPHILEEVTKALPDFTWLVSLEFLPTPAGFEDDMLSPPVRFQVEGRTADIQGYTRFLRQLANSPWLSEVDFGPAQQVIEDERSVTAFSLTATFRTADSTFIRTVPVLESVR